MTQTLAASRQVLASAQTHAEDHQQLGKVTLARRKEPAATQAEAGKEC